MDYCVFIQANDRQMLGAIVAEYALRRYSQHNDRFDVRIMNYDDIPVFRQYEGQRFLRDGGRRVWVRECLEKGVVTETQLREAMEHNHLRHDALELIEHIPPLAA